MITIGTWDMVRFWLYLLNHNSLSNQTWSIDIYICKGNNFQKSFQQFGGLGLGFQVLFHLATCSNYSVTNYVKISAFHFFEKVNKGQLKMVVSTIKNGQISLYWHFDKIIKGPGTSFQSPASSKKHVRNVCHMAH